jgi:glycosyltransferase involved in cell wall biosynthesis
MSGGQRVSVIIPSYQQAKFLGRAIRSVTGQDYPGLECIVVDGGSTDGSVDVIRQHRDQLAWSVSERDNGQSHAFNKGLARATGSIIGWLNSDDLYLDACLHRAVHYFTVHPAIDIVFADYAFIDQIGSVLRVRREPRFNAQLYIWTADCYHANCAGFFRRRVFDAIGGLDESIHYGMDYEWYLRAARAGFQFGHVRAVWGAYRLHPASKSVKSSALMRQESGSLARRFRSAPTSVWQAAARRAAWGYFRIAQKLLIGAYLPTGRKIRELVAAADAS